jgi:hypothetical protein
MGASDWGVSMPGLWRYLVSIMVYLTASGHACRTSLSSLC